jgi:hypothetical protein
LVSIVTAFCSFDSDQQLNVMKAYKTIKFYDQAVNFAAQAPAVPPLADQKMYQLDTANRVYFEASLAKYLNQDTLRLLNDEIVVADFRYCIAVHTFFTRNHKGFMGWEQKKKQLPVRGIA